MERKNIRNPSTPMLLVWFPLQNNLILHYTMCIIFLLTYMLATFPFFLPYFSVLVSATIFSYFLKLHYQAKLQPEMKFAPMLNLKVIDFQIVPALQVIIVVCFLPDKICSWQATSPVHYDMLLKQEANNKQTKTKAIQCNAMQNQTKSMGENLNIILDRHVFGLTDIIHQMFCSRTSLLSFLHLF